MRSKKRTKEQNKTYNNNRHKNLKEEAVEGGPFLGAVDHWFNDIIYRKVGCTIIQKSTIQDLLLKGSKMRLYKIFPNSLRNYSYTRLMLSHVWPTFCLNFEQIAKDLGWNPKTESFFRPVIPYKKDQKINSDVTSEDPILLQSDEPNDVFNTSQPDLNEIFNPLHDDFLSMPPELEALYEGKNPPSEFDEQSDTQQNHQDSFSFF